MLEVIGWLAGCLTTLSFVPQVVLALRTRDLSGISIRMYVAFCVGGAPSPPVVAANAVTLVLAATILILTIRHRHQS